MALLSAAEPADDLILVGQPGQDVAGVPQEIADGVRAILTADGARGLPPQRWPRVQGDAARLLEGGWLERAFAFGWTPADLFGCDRRAPWHRLDRAGLVLLTGGHEILELTGDSAALRTSTRSVLRYRRRQPAIPAVALLWELLISTQTTGPRVRRPTSTSEPGADRGGHSWPDSAAILTTITHEGTIMAGSTLRVQRGEATAISVVGLLRRSGAQP